MTRPSSLFLGVTDDSTGDYGLSQWGAARQHGIGGPGSVSKRRPLSFWLDTHELMPAGLGGVCAFRGLELHFRCESPTRIFLLPVVDGDLSGAGAPTAEYEQHFSGGPDVQVARAWCARRGERIAARVIARSSDALVVGRPQLWGAFEVVDLRALFVPVRAAPASPRQVG